MPSQIAAVGHTVRNSVPELREVTPLRVATLFQSLLDAVGIFEVVVVYDAIESLLPDEQLCDFVVTPE